ncbi:MAG: 3-hydroxyacyl-CoA dehydrogenase family protein [Bacteroidetes bacterium]|nr:3-hydroxyacyl-CoA dehydrogenase family protein [Bacteroidota bacterium]
MSQISQVGILGEGKMGTDILTYLLDFHFELVWVCSPEADIEKLTWQLNTYVKQSFDAGITGRHRFDKVKRTVISRNLTDLALCDMVIEALPETGDLKKNMFLLLDRVVKPGAIFASNSSSFNPSEMAPAGQRKAKFTGLLFFYPVHLKNIVEITVNQDTTAQTQSHLESFLSEIGRRFITLEETNSFILNRIFLDVLNEAFLLVHAGNCSYGQMDQLVITHLFPIGIFGFCDRTGLDTMLTAILNYLRNYPHKSYFFQLTAAMSELVSQGKLGVKTHQGFYNYPQVEIAGEEPENSLEIIGYLRQTWFSSAKRYTAQAHAPIDDANHAIREFFEISKGPFEH